MSRPPLLVRVAGSPLPALLLFVSFTAVIADWYQGGGVPWWLALGAALAAMRTLSAVGRVRRYKAWLAEWNAMDAQGEPAPGPKKKSGGWVLVTGAALLLLAIPAYLPQAHDEGLATALELLWGVAGLYLVFRILRGMMRRRKERPQEQAEAAPVECLLGRAASSPSRSEAARKLPEYVTRLFGS
jgi:hypothetical protein